MEISEIVIEVRPRLQCANFFIQFSQHFASQDAVNLNVRSNAFTIKIDDRHYSIDLKNFINLNTRTLSQLVIKRNYVSFRINTNEHSFQNTPSPPRHPPPHDEVNANTKTQFKLSPALNFNEESDIRCSNCDNIFLQKQSFDRVLELPSDNLDFSDWFCHKPHDMKTPQDVFSPKCNEIFYGTFYFLVNFNQFQSTRTKGKLIYCRRCLQFMGELQNNSKNSIKLWNDTVTFTNQSFFSNNPIQNFTFILKKLQHDFTMDLPGFPQLFKVIFEATLPSGRQHFLLLQVMDHNLDILRMKHDSTNLELEKSKAIKLLYKLEQDRENPLVSFWLGNTNINSMQISPKMFNAAAEYLNKMSQLIPECYRTSQGFVLSYLDL